MAGNQEYAGVEDTANAAMLRASRLYGAVTALSLSSVREDLTFAQYRTLLALAEQGPQTVTTLADLLGVHASTMTRMCSRLVTRNLVDRSASPADRREVVIVLSPVGTDLVKAVNTAHRQRFTAIVKTLSEAERQAMVTGLHAFVLAASEHLSEGMTKA